MLFRLDYQAEELAGKDAVFKCKVHEIKEEQLPELDDDKKDNNIYLIAVTKFIRFYSGAKSVYAQTAEAEFHISKRLYELEESLPMQFVRVSHSEIINLDYVSHFSLSAGGIINITFKNGTKTSSSRRYLKKIKEVLYHEK